MCASYKNVDIIVKLDGEIYKDFVLRILIEYNAHGLANKPQKEALEINRSRSYNTC